MDPAEIGLGASSREMARGDEGLSISPPVLEHVASDLGMAAGVGVPLAEATMDLCGGVPPLGRSPLVVGEDPVDDRHDRAEGRGLAGPGRRGRGFGMVEGIPGGLARVSELSGDPPDGQAIATSPPNRAIVVRREHVPGLREGDSLPVGTFTLTEAATVGFSWTIT